MKKHIAIENSLLQLRLTEESDLDWVLETERHPENRDYVYNWSRERHLACIDSKDEAHFMVLRKPDLAPVGYVILSDLESQHDVISFDRIVIREKGKGYGRQTVRVVTKLCFEQYGCHRLWLDVFDNNPQAKMLYESEGFVFEGTLRDCKKREGNRLSMHVLSMLASEYARRKENDVNGKSV